MFLAEIRDHLESETGDHLESIKSKSDMKGDNKTQKEPLSEKGGDITGEDYIDCAGVDCACGQRRLKRQVIMSSCCTCTNIQQGKGEMKQENSNKKKKEEEKEEIKSYEQSYEISGPEEDNDTSFDFEDNKDYLHSEQIEIPDDRISWRRRRKKKGTRTLQ